MTEPDARLVRFFKLLIRRPIAVMMLTLAILGASAIATYRIPIEMLPKGLAGSAITISAPWPGANPAEVELRVVRPLEDELRGLAGIKETVSVAMAGAGRVNLIFPGDADMDQVHAEVADRVERVRPLLPRDADRVRVMRMQLDDMPIMWLGVTYSEDAYERAQETISNVLIPRIEAVDGVAATRVNGVEPTSVRILLDEDKTLANRVDIGALVARLQADNLSLPVGDLEGAGSRYIVRVDSRFKSLKEVEDFPVREGLTLGDIGRVIEARSAPEFFFKVNGEFAVGISVQKETAANTFQVCQAVSKLVEEELPNDPLLGGMDYAIFWNQGDNIKQNLEGLVMDAAKGGAIAMLVLMLFLRRLRYTILVAASIPFAVLVTLAYLYFSGDTFNIMTMTGITISIGMLVDNSVVIVESIFTRREKGEELGKACAHGPAEVMIAVITATLTTVVVFVPLIFMSTDNNIRVFTGAIGIPLCISLLAALLLAIVIVPVASYRLGGRDHAKQGEAKKDKPKRKNKLTKLMDAISPLAFLKRAMPRLVAWSLDHPLRAITISMLALMSISIARSGQSNTGGMQMGSQLEGDFEIRGAANLLEAHEIVLKVERALMDEELLKDIGSPDIGVGFDRTSGQINLWHDSAPDAEDADRYLEILNERLPQMAAVEYRFGEQFNQRSTEDQKGWIGMQLEGPDSMVLQGITNELRSEAVASGLFEEVSKDLNTSKEIRVTMDRQLMAEAGVNSQTLTGNMEWNLRGFMVSRFQKKYEDIPLILEYDDPENPDKSDLVDMSIWTNTGAVPLSSFASFSHGEGPAAISRRNGRTVAAIGFKAKESDLKKAADLLVTFMKDRKLPEGYHWKQLGGLSEFEEGAKDIQRALTLSVALVFLLMGLLFNSLILPLSVLITVPFAMVGYYWAFRITGQAGDLLSMVGLIVLAGVVVNNGIVLLDRILHLEARGWSRRQAILDGVRDRLRPVLMTALTTICGLLPIAMSKAQSGSFSFQGLAIGISGGLIVSTIFTLWTVPLIYHLLRDLTEWWARIRGSNTSADPSPSPSQNA
jgi:hydrophobic/amphiphilic exporter-1 (mainly G- bacteria), HAE1 family